MYFRKKTGETLETTNFVILGFLAGFIYLFYKKMYKHALFLFLLMFVVLMIERRVMNLDFVKSLSLVKMLLFYISLHIITNVVQILYIVFAYKGTEYFYKVEMDYVETSQEEFLKLRYKEKNSIFGAIFKLMYYCFGFLIYFVSAYYLFTFLLSEMNMLEGALFFKFSFYLSIVFFVSVITIYLALFITEVLRFAKIIANFRQ